MMHPFFKHVKELTLKRVKQMDSLPPIQNNTLPFCEIFRSAKTPTIIAEIKLATPRQGRIYPGSLSILEIAEEYLTQGAKALSILTEPHYFEGQIEFIQQIRKGYPKAHLLCKDFILDPVQIDQACYMGANAILLIVGFLEISQLRELYHYALSHGLSPLLEVHTESEIQTALDLNPTLIGINQRNLQTLNFDLSLAERLKKLIPNDIHVICESGITTFTQLSHLHQIGFDGFLIGSHLMRHAHPGLALHHLLQGEH